MIGCIRCHGPTDHNGRCYRCDRPRPSARPPGSANEEKRGAECKLTGRKYRTVDELVDAECSDEVKAEYYRLRAEEGKSPSV